MNKKMNKLKKAIWENDLNSFEIQKELMNQFQEAVKMLHPEKFLIVADLDGTLLKSDCSISQITKNVIKILTDNGHIFCIATGRPWRSARIYYEVLGLKTLICNLNGSVIFNPQDEQMKPINYVFSISILENLCKDSEIMAMVENIIVEDGQNLRTYKKLNPKNIDLLSNWFHINLNEHKPINGFEDMFEAKKAIPSILIKITSDADIDNIISLIKGRIKTLTCQLWSLDDDSHILEVNTVFAHKGNSLKFLSSFYGIPWDKTMSFGDGYNDMKLVSDAHYGYAMKNGKTTVKFVARGVTKYDNDNNGVARKIQEFFIKRCMERNLINLPKKQL